MAIFKVEVPDSELDAEKLTPDELAVMIRDTINAGVHAPGGIVQMNNVTVAAQDPAAPDEIEEARERYATDELEIDEDAVTSRADRDDGLWVSAWVWLSRMGSVFIHEDKALRTVTVSQGDTGTEEVFTYDTDDEREQALSEARESADALIDGYSGALVYDDTLEAVAA